MFAASELCNCSSNLARLNNTVTLFHGSSTVRPSSSSWWNNCVYLYLKMDELASTAQVFTLLSSKVIHMPSPRASLKLCWANWKIKASKQSVINYYILNFHGGRKTSTLISEKECLLYNQTVLKENLSYINQVKWKLHKPQTLPFQNAEHQYYSAFLLGLLDPPFSLEFVPAKMYQR